MMNKSSIPPNQFPSDYETRNKTISPTFRAPTPPPPPPPPAPDKK